MAFAIKSELQGLETCLGKLRALPRSFQRRILRKGVRSSCQAGAKNGRGQVPRGKHGLLRKALGNKVFKHKAGSFTAAGMVGIRSKPSFRRVIDGQPHDPSNYAHLVEGGTRTHIIMARAKKALAFKGGGRTANKLQGIKGRRARSIVVQSVQHPGSRPQRFLQKIRVTGQHAMSNAFRRTVETELHREAAKARPSEVDDGL